MLFHAVFRMAAASFIQGICDAGGKWKLILLVGRASGLASRVSPERSEAGGMNDQSGRGIYSAAGVVPVPVPCNGAGYTCKARWSWSRPRGRGAAAAGELAAGDCSFFRTGLVQPKKPRGGSKLFRCLARGGRRDE